MRLGPLVTLIVVAPPSDVPVRRRRVVDGVPGGLELVGVRTRVDDRLGLDPDQVANRHSATGINVVSTADDP
jgi:hypothetical protein